MPRLRAGIVVAIAQCPRSRDPCDPRRSRVDERPRQRAHPLHPFGVAVPPVALEGRDVAEQRGDFGPFCTPKGGQGGPSGKHPRNRAMVVVQGPSGFGDESLREQQRRIIPACLARVHVRHGHECFGIQLPVRVDVLRCRSRGESPNGKQRGEESGLRHRGRTIIPRHTGRK